MQENNKTNEPSGKGSAAQETRPEGAGTDSATLRVRPAGDAKPAEGRKLTEVQKDIKPTRDW